MAAVKVSSLQALQDQPLQRVTIAGKDILLVKLVDGVYAVSDQCTHGRVSLAQGHLEGDIICCPKHGGKFNVKTGKAVAFPAITKLPQYDVHVDGDDVYVTVE
ncbi:MAG: non-heme iron oxygenase ferredoxin subunit [Acidibacillus sp.]|uniref:Ferredoxin CarAc n=1 Tax=Sulfoacidibacillus ferrooxidans TaxID=2005001 RepID=A0A9X1V9Y0_9BACL|nr:non-heme iron oxygenase ferredoxin subunit [Sulfoacidibacillus ferrooxidans]MCI0182848.1 Ferredoxin CarAc [Sulfoacidibacillus ferrooxidans]MCY0893252.1 non-heme iron oxygenase ferredoxin subunit [Acidibacillus sp.]